MTTTNRSAILGHQADGTWQVFVVEPGPAPWPIRTFTTIPTIQARAEALQELGYEIATPGDEWSWTESTDDDEAVALMASISVRATATR